jgi:hypothetical protein
MFIPMASTADGPWLSLNEKTRGPVSGSTSTATPSAEPTTHRQMRLVAADFV